MFESMVLLLVLLLADEHNQALAKTNAFVKCSNHGAVLSTDSAFVVSANGADDVCTYV